VVNKILTVQIQTISINVIQYFSSPVKNEMPAAEH